MVNFILKTSKSLFDKSLSSLCSMLNKYHKYHTNLFSVVMPRTKMNKYAFGTKITFHLNCEFSWSTCNHLFLAQLYPGWNTFTRFLLDYITCLLCKEPFTHAVGFLWPFPVEIIYQATSLSCRCILHTYNLIFRFCRFFRFTNIIII